MEKLDAIEAQNSEKIEAVKSEIVTEFDAKVASFDEKVAALEAKVASFL